ncbi:shikimate dehydrogenase [Ramlibacter tataouinensis]|uniref:shikimate dehydrogenase family protein n=1 Tax=Ramlibacter tataouinensis TaxID=94132 RepID=UPI0022F3E076|nr:shikimate dehydrogenase [Ramlibacter tataouinensis]WBY02882.1 shikimate dehydrogenase [Ramlibacter tataouinensis]
MIRGTTQLVAIIGSPIAQVKSPENFNAWFDAAGADLAMVPMDVRAGELDACLALLRGWQNLRGCVVTVPYKQAFATRVDALSRRAAALGAVNVVRREADGRLVADMVDGLGFLGAAQAHGFAPAGARAVVVGAGGVGSAIAYALCEAGVGSLALLDVDAGRQARLAAVLRNGFPEVDLQLECASLAGVDLLVNATPVGMGDTGALPLDPALLQTLGATAHVADVVTSPVVTPLLELARTRGCTVQTGPEMAKAQLGHLGVAMGVMPESHA